MMYNLFIDDERNPQQFYNQPFVVARNYDQAVNIVLRDGLPQFISFDHDLGDFKDGVERTGFTFAKFLVDYMMDNNTTVFDFVVHSANPIGAENINCYLMNYFNSR